MFHRLIVASMAAGAIAVTAIGTASSAIADPPYRNCTEAHQDGRYNISSTDPAYNSKLDRDGDGYANRFLGNASSYRTIADARSSPVGTGPAVTESYSVGPHSTATT
jgi:hypothetical protein